MVFAFDELDQDENAAISVGEFYCVGQEIQHDLCDPFRIRFHNQPFVKIFEPRLYCDILELCLVLVYSKYLLDLSFYVEVFLCFCKVFGALRKHIVVNHIVKEVVNMTNRRMYLIIASLQIMMDLLKFDQSKIIHQTA